MRSRRGGGWGGQQHKGYPRVWKAVGVVWDEGGGRSSQTYHDTSALGILLIQLSVLTSAYSCCSLMAANVLIRFTVLYNCEARILVFFPLRVDICREARWIFFSVLQIKD